MPTLHGHPLSPYVRKVLITLAEKQIDFEHDPVMHFALPMDTRSSTRCGRFPSGPPTRGSTCPIRRSSSPTSTRCGPSHG